MAGPIYEVSLTVDAPLAGDLDDWLGGHVDDMLELPAFESARVFVADEEAGKATRVVQYTSVSRAALDGYLQGTATHMRQSGIDRFGDRMSASRRIIQENANEVMATESGPVCRNCNNPLSGQYCASCGQRARNRLISLWELLREAFGDLLELDSRLWRTLIPLLTRPGKLTRDYLEGRRARFMPPFRTYLVLSLLFLFLAVFDPREQFSIFFEPEPADPATQPAEIDGPTEESEQAGETVSSADEIRDRVLEELNEEDTIPDELVDEIRQIAEDAGDEGRLVNITTNSDGDSGCDDIDPEDMEGMPKWMARRLTPERLKAVCEKIEADDGRSLGEKLIDSVPAALFVLLPLMAFVLKLLYPLSKRYYVEHLLFVVHYHAFFFLMLILMILFAGLAGLLGLPEAIAPIVITAGSFYIPVYLYKSIRKVYLQSHLITIPKYILLIVAYFAGLATIAGVTVVLAAFSI